MRKQVVLTAPSKVLVGTYLTAKGKRLAEQGATEDELVKYTKNRYRPNPASKPFKTFVSLEGKGKTKTRILTHLN